MATFYLDYEGGNDANDGTTFANRWKTFTSGATAARIAPGDTIRVMGTPDATSMAQAGAWTGSTLNSTVSITSSTNASPIVVTKTSHGLTTGDTVVISGHTTNTAANGVWEVIAIDANTFSLTGSTGNGVGGASGSFRQINNLRVKLTSAVTANIGSFANLGEGRVAWTASANVTASLITTDTKCSDQGDSIAIAAGFTTGLAAYFPTGTLNLSTYKQVSFWIKQTSGTVATAGQMTLTLCSDAAGVTAVNTISIPALIALNQWYPVTVDTGAALGASIQSVALNVASDVGAQTFLISNIIACKDSTSADSLTLNSLIGKNTAGETYWAIQSINGTRVMLDRDVNSFTNNNAANMFRGYGGTTESVTTYKREPVFVSAGLTTTDNGTSASHIIYDCGYDRTAMTTKNLETWYTFRSTTITGLTIQNNYIDVNNLHLVRGAYGFYINNAVGGIYDAITGNNNLTYGVDFFQGSGKATFTNRTTTCANGNNGFQHNSSSPHVTCANILADSNGAQNAGYGIQATTASDWTITTFTSRNNIGYGLGINPSVKVYGGSTNYNSVASINSGGVVDEIHVSGCTLNEALQYNSASGVLITGNATLFSENDGGTAGYHKITMGYGIMQTDTTTRHTASGVSWSLAPTNAYRDAQAPLSLRIAKIAVAASTLVTVTAYMQRSNTGLTMSLVCKGGQISGVASDVSSSMTAAANTWEQLTITFTPSAAGVVEITAEAYGGTTYTGYVDDITVSQA